MKVFFHNYFKDNKNKFVTSTAIVGYLVLLLKADFELFILDLNRNRELNLKFLFYAFIFMVIFATPAISFALSSKLQNLGVKISYCIVAIDSVYSICICVIDLFAVQSLRILFNLVCILMIIGLSIVLILMSIEYFALEEVERNQESAGYNPADSPFLN